MQFEHIVDVHLEQGRLAEVELGPTLYEEDSNGLKLGVRLWKNGEAVDVTGTVSGWAIVSTGQTISPFDDTGYDGNEAWVLVPQGALIPGRVEIFLRITGDSDAAVTLHATGTVRRTKTGEIIVPGDPLPDVDQLRQIAQRCEDAAEAAEELTTNAVQYTAQTKDASAQAVARKNIGAENASAVRVIPNVVGYIAATSTAETVEVDENGVPVNAGSSTTTVRYIVLPCSPGDRITVRSPSLISNNTRNWMMLGAVDTSTTPNTRPILAKHKNAATPTVFTAPAGTELVVFASTKTRIASDTDRYWMGGMTEARLDALEVQQETVSGTTPSITAEANHRYVCGTLGSLSFTPSAEGLCEVIFTAGSDMVLSLPSSVRMPDWWTGVEANRTYDIMVLDGTLGAVMSWT